MKKIFLILMLLFSTTILRASVYTIGSDDFIVNVPSPTIKWSLGFSTMTEPSTPAAWDGYIYLGTDKKLYLKDDTGAVTDLTAAGGGVTDHADLTSTGTVTHAGLETLIGDLETSTSTLEGYIFDLWTSTSNLEGYITDLWTSTSTLETAIALNTTHRGSDGSDHTFINQDVTSGSSPNFDNSAMTGDISVWTNDSGYITISSVTYEGLLANDDIGTSNNQVAAGTHTHTLAGDVTGDIGSTVVGFDSHSHSTATLVNFDQTLATTDTPTFSSMTITGAIAGSSITITNTGTFGTITDGTLTMTDGNIDMATGDWIGSGAGSTRLQWNFPANELLVYTTLVLDATDINNAGNIHISDGSGLYTNLIGGETAGTPEISIIKTVDITGGLVVSTNIAGATYASDASVTDAELKYINTLSSNAQDQIDAISGDNLGNHIATTTVNMANFGIINIASMTSPGSIEIMPSGDTDDYFQFSTTADVPGITTVGSCNLSITASGGTIDFGDDNITTTGTGAAATFNTGQGAYELYAMNQDVESTDAVTFATVDTGQGANELFDMDQNVLEASTPLFSSMTITNGLRVIGQVKSNNRVLIDIYDKLTTITTPYGLTTGQAYVLPDSGHSYAVTYSTMTGWASGGGSVIFMIEQRALISIDSAGTDAWTGDVTADNTWRGGTSNDFTKPANYCLVVVITSVSGDVRSLTIKRRFTVDP